MGKNITTTYINATLNGIQVDHGFPAYSGNYNTCNSRQVNYIVMHYTANAKDTAINNCRYFMSKRQSSAHFFVDDSHIQQSVKLKDKAWHCGTSGTYYHASCRNSNSIGIEMCTSGNAIVSTKTQENAAYLCAYLCQQLGITKNQVDTYVLRHYDVTHKMCPAQYVKEPQQWIDFKSKVKDILYVWEYYGAPGQTVAQPAQPQKEEEEVTQEQFNQMMDNYIAEQAKKDPDDWAKDSLSWATANGIMQGDEQGRLMGKKFITRQEVVTLLKRIYDKLNK